MPSEGSTDFICITCKTDLILLSETFHCSNCRQEYIVFDKICLLVNQPLAYLAESYYLYKAHIQAQLNEVKKLKQYYEGKKEKANILSNLITAIHHNADLVSDVTTQLLPYVSPELLFQVQINPNNQVHDYLKDFRYLRRDWVWENEGEEQLAIINQSLRETIQKSNGDDTNVLVLGAGLGRIAYDLSAVFEKVYATDYSFSMAYYFQRLISNDIFFYEVNANNVYHNTDHTRKVRASIHPPFRDENSSSKDIQKLEYFIADVQQLPIKDKSISCVVSAYFTDVLAWKLWFDEVKRVLKDGGVFIHFGPLGYPFSDVSERLSAEDIKSYLVTDGFHIIEDGRVATKHLASSLSMDSNLHNCWLLGARKVTNGAIPEVNELTSSSVLAIAKEVTYRVTGEINNNNEIKETTELILNHNQVFSGATIALAILKLIDGKKDLQQIIEELALSYEINKSEEEYIYHIIKELITKSVIKINKV